MRALQIVFPLAAWLVVLAALVYATPAVGVVEFREVCVKAHALGLVGRGVYEVAFLARVGDGFIYLPYRVGAEEVSLSPLLINMTDAGRYVFNSHVLPPRFKNDTVICISIPLNTARPPPRAPRGGDLYQIGEAYVVVSPRQPYDPPPSPVIGPKPSSVPIKKVGVVEAAGPDAEPLAAASTAVRTISGGFKTRAASNTTVAAYGMTFTTTPIDLPNGTRYIWLAFTNVTQPGSYSLYYKIYDAENNAVYFEGTVTTSVDGRSPYYSVIPIPVYQKAYNRLLKLYLAVKNNNPTPRAVDLVIVGVFDTSRHMDNRWAAGMATRYQYGFPSYVVPYDKAYAAIPIHIPPGGVHGTERVRAKLGLSICSPNAPSAVTADVYIRPIWVGSITFTYSYRDAAGCAVYTTAEGTFTGFLPTPYLLLGTTDLAVGPLPAGSRITVYELYVEGYRRPEFNRPWSPYLYSSTWLDGTFVVNSVLRVEAYPLTTGASITGMVIRISLSPIVTPSGVIPLSSGEHVITYSIYAPIVRLSPPQYAVEGRQTTLSDHLLPIVKRLNAILSALGVIIDRTARDPRGKMAYKVVTFAGKVAEGALSSAKTTVSVSSSSVNINVGWEETKNVVTVWIDIFTEGRPEVQTDVYSFKSPYATIPSELPVSSTIRGLQPLSIDNYRTWYCLYQHDLLGEACREDAFR
ncbi:hypothetical protein Pogu_2707 [Pyrobaculum oguniense TE7]|uniref:Uncharacterized protein n=1 Tax=Pyrobaculum oguniense (strain DSM 13380 / JCM 10595 / TE7) TaxID=698757 RepID=H6QDW4_PYROT|nr:hypothetical protein Pogu_2707 [Pyrobaculum oguniense TE7]